ncbi:GNAT family N-acetyltransferase [Bacillus suaedae]|uniref:GNAT family N-acetyltransferase n=1 Tax=Halalkalibacter suaedae TaxID=2822140 RepID=A0A940WSD4_9BACI|nr:GNAT family N-acetyltransferase [Bacillus suaedae]MBP3949552.1 GNAT family N-acetyltransferase [Bacillus suaedae]
MIIKLTVKQVEQFRNLRLEGLKETPNAFAASVEEEEQQPLAFFEAKLRKSDFYGVLENNTLLGMISLTRSSMKKMSHKASLGGFYVGRSARGQGIGKQLLIYALEKAREQGIELVHLVVSVKNPKAKKLYQSLGFEVFAYEKKALKIGIDYIDEEYMLKEL